MGLRTSRRSVPPAPSEVTEESKRNANPDPEDNGERRMAATFGRGIICGKSGSWNSIQSRLWLDAHRATARRIDTCALRCWNFRAFSNDRFGSKAATSPDAAIAWLGERFRLPSLADIKDRSFAFMCSCNRLQGHLMQSIAEFAPQNPYLPTHVGCAIDCKIARATRTQEKQ